MVCRPTVREVSGGGISKGNRETLECGAPHGIHGGDPADNTGGTEGPRYLPQDHAAPGFVGDWAVFRPLSRYCSREPISANTNRLGQ